MPRQSFITSIHGSCYRNGILDSTCSDSQFCQELVSGVQRKKPEGFMSPTAYYFNRDRYERHNGTVYFHRTGGGAAELYGDVYSGVVGIGTGTSIESRALLDGVYKETGIPPAWMDKAIIKARLQMKQQDLNAVVAAAELNKTAVMVGGIATQLSKAGLRLLAKDVKGAARELGVLPPRGKPRGSNITDAWLQLKYGWEPLLQDAHGAAMALAGRPGSDWMVTGKGTVRENIRVVNHVDADQTIAAYGVGSATGTKGVQVRIDALPENNMLQVAASLGVTNPGVVAWELVPFSFVVDWFLPVGAFLDSFDALLGYGQPWCSISTFERFHVEHRLVDSDWTSGDPSNPFSNEWVRSGTARREYVYLKRSADTFVPLPSLPRLKNPASFGHLANGLALLASVFR